MASPKGRRHCRFTSPPGCRRDSKTGARVVPLPPLVATVLGSLSRVRGNPWVFGEEEGNRQHNTDDSWDRVRKRAGLDGSFFPTSVTALLRVR